MELINYNTARHALAEARRVDEVKDIRDKAEALRIYSQQAKDRDLEVWSAEIRTRAEARAGELLRKMEKAKGAREPGTNRGTTQSNGMTASKLADLGITKQQSSDWQKLAAMPEAEREQRIGQAVAARVAPTATIILKSATRNQATHSSDTDRWNTPPDIITRVVAVMRQIDLDPCAEHAKAIPAKRHYTTSDDGLSKAWVGRVYMNPPYGDAIDSWVEKLVSEYNEGGVTQAIALVPSRTDTLWFRRFYPNNTPVCFIGSRLKFSGAENSAPFPSAVFYLGGRQHSFAQHFSPIGVIFMPAYDWLFEGEDQDEAKLGKSLS